MWHLLGKTVYAVGCSHTNILGQREVLVRLPVGYKVLQPVVMARNGNFAKHARTNSTVDEYETNCPCEKVQS